MYLDKYEPGIIVLYCGGFIFNISQMVFIALCKKTPRMNTLLLP